MSGNKPVILVPLAAFAALVFLWLVTASSAQEKEKADKRELQAKEAAEQFMKAVNAGDVEGIMKIVDVPFFFGGMENIKAGDELKKKFERQLEAPPHLEYKVWAMPLFGSLAKNFFSDHDDKLLKEILEKTDRLVVFEVQGRGIAVAVRTREGKAKVVGIRPDLSLLALVFAMPEKEKGDKRALEAKETAQRFLKAGKDKDLDSLMKLSDVPWYSDGNHIKDRDALKKVMESSLARNAQFPLEVVRAVTYGEIRELLMEQRRELADQIFVKEDWAVLVQGGRKQKGGLLFVRVRDGKGKVIGVAE